MMIYFIGNEHGAIKIGYTADLNTQSRLNGLQTANADQLIVLGYEDGTEIDESILHTKFAHLKIRGEWFVATDELLDYILSLLTTDKENIQNWAAAMFPKGNTADLQRLRSAEQIHMDVLDKANKQAQDIARTAHVRANQIIAEAEQRYNQIISFATDCAASDIKELVAGNCDPPLFDCRCCKCGRARHTVKEREDGIPWCDPCWINYIIFDSGRFDAIIAQANDTVPPQYVNTG